MPLDHALLREILTQPTAPFREGHVIRVLQAALARHHVPFFTDPAGNTVVGVASKKEYLSLLSKKSQEPVRIYIAHMDHPGFHGVRWKNEKTLEIKWHGGSPTAFLEGASLWVSDRKELFASATMTKAVLHKSGKLLESGEIQFKEPVQRKAKDLLGGFSFRSPVWEEGQYVYTKAADDLVGCFSILSTAIELFSKKRNKGWQPPFLGLLTRAEEVGFIGTIAHMELGWHKKAKRPLLCVSLETSRALPGAEIGKGPVVRLGDRFTVFDSGSLRIFTDLAEKTLPGKFQRRIMDGGTCEATAATVFGVPSVGISVPLGNYHNQSFEGGPDSRGDLGPAPEFVHLGDVQGMITLCKALMKPNLPWHQPWLKRMNDFKKLTRKYGSLMDSAP